MSSKPTSAGTLHWGLGAHTAFYIEMFHFCSALSQSLWVSQQRLGVTSGEGYQHSRFWCHQNSTKIPIQSQNEWVIFFYHQLAVILNPSTPILPQLKYLNLSLQKDVISHTVTITATTATVIIIVPSHSHSKYTKTWGRLPSSPAGSQWPSRLGQEPGRGQVAVLSILSMLSPSTCCCLQLSIPWTPTGNHHLFKPNHNLHSVQVHNALNSSLAQAMSIPGGQDFPLTLNPTFGYLKPSFWQGSPFPLNTDTNPCPYRTELVSSIPAPRKWQLLQEVINARGCHLQLCFPQKGLSPLASLHLQLSFT